MSSLKEEQTNNFDDALNIIGPGRWTLFSYSVYIAWAAIIPLMSFAPVFMNPPIEYRCYEPQLHNASWTQEEKQNFTIYVEEENNGVLSKCWQYDRNYSAAASVKFSEAINTTVVEDKKSCSHWHFDNSTFHSTIASEWNLVCENAYLNPLFGSSYFFGLTLGEPSMGYFADLYGRRTVIRIGAVVWVVAASSMVIISNLYAILLARFILGVIHAIGTGVAYVLAIEACPPDYRTVGGLILTTSHAFTGIFYGGLAYLVRDWRTLQLVCCCPSIIIICLIFVMDESPRWLYRKGKRKEAIAILEKAARWQGVTLPPTEQLLTLQLDHESSSYEGFGNYVRQGWNDLVSLMSRPLIRRTTIVMLVCWFVVGLSFWGISLSGGNYSSDPFLYIVLSSIMEIPGYSGFIPFVAKFGRRTVLSINLFISATVTLLILATGSATTGTLVLALIGKLFISGAYNILYLSASELFPTNMRSRGLNLSSMMARIASIIAPFIQIYMVAANWWISSVMFGCSCVIAACLALLLPESNKKPLPETLDQFDQIYGDAKNTKVEDIQLDKTNSE